MDEKQKNSIIIKSPGKSLLSGGYLILDKSKRGLVINIDTYISCESYYLIKGKSNESEKNSLLFNIYSEYLNQNFNYIVSMDFNNDNELKIFEKNDKDNKWIKNCIISSLLIYLSKNNNFIDLFNSNNKIEINITIKSDYRFYSYSPDNISQKVKTGLGSSSAFINSLTSNLILTYDKILNKKIYPKNIVIKNLVDNNIKAIILGSCLLSNNLSQNKIGSCFDIISSLFGSQIFIQTQQNIFLNSPFYLNEENKSKINNFIEYLKSEYIPNILFLNENNKYLKNKIYFVSIEIGSDTRIFVKKVLEYANNKKKDKLFDDDLFSQLNALNEKIINLFLNNSNIDTIIYSSMEYYNTYIDYQKNCF